MGTTLKKLSVIIPITGKWRANNLSICLEFLRRQTFKDFEVVLVEQINCGIARQRSKNTFFKNALVDKYIAITNSINHEFNQPWMLNVGAKLAEGEKLLFFDVDLIVRAHYLRNVYEFNEPFFYAWNACFHYTQRISNGVYRKKKLLKDPDAIKYTPGMQAHEGYAIGADRAFFFEKIGCYNENLFGWGGNDNEIAARVRHILGSPFKALPVPVFHLWHPRSYAKTTNRKFVINARKFPQKIINTLLKHKLGNPNNPTIIQMENK